MISALLLFTAAQASAPFDARNSYSLARQHCAAEWPNDFAMQKHCLETQVEGMRKFVASSRSVGRPLDKALEKCVEQWTKSGRPDFMMIGHCAEEQAEAYRNLNR